MLVQKDAEQGTQNIMFGLGEFYACTSCAWRCLEAAFPRKFEKYKIVLAQVALGLGGTQKLLSKENLKNTKLCSHNLRLVLVEPRGQL